MARARTLRMCLVAVVGVSAAACGGSSSKSSKPTPTVQTPAKICAALSSAEAMNILGKPVEEPKATPGSMAGCLWRAKGDGPSTDAILVVARPGGAPTLSPPAAPTSPGAPSSVPNGSFSDRAVTGVGESAVFRTTTNTAPNSPATPPVLLVTSKGTTYTVAIRLTGASAQDIESKELAVAKALLRD